MAMLETTPGAAPSSIGKWVTTTGMLAAFASAITGYHCGSKATMTIPSLPWAMACLAKAMASCGLEPCERSSV